MGKRLAHTCWPWVGLGLAIQGTLFLVSVRFVERGDISGAYLISPDRYRGSILEEVYPRDTIRLAMHPYDSYYFLALANDPALRWHVAHGDETGWVFYRGRRMLWPWAGWALGLGRPRLILYTLPLSQFLVFGLGLWALARVLRAHGRHPAWSLLHALALGTTICVVRPLADLFAANLLLLGAWAWLVRRDGWAALGFALACLAKETSILLPTVLGAAALARGEWRRSRWLLVVPAVLLVWWGSIAARVPAVAMDARNLGVPFAALGERLMQSPVSRGAGEAVAHWMSVACIASVFLAPRRAWDEWRLALVPMALLAVLSTAYIWYDYWSYGRVHMALPTFLLWCYAVRGRTPDLVGPIGSAIAGLLVWYSQLGHHLGLLRLLRGA